MFSGEIGQARSNYKIEQKYQIIIIMADLKYVNAILC